MMRAFWNRLRLNARAAKLALSGRWLHGADVASSYDSVAATYDKRWLVHLQSTTDQLHERLPESLPSNGAILELGCGSGYSTLFLRKKYLDIPLLAVDISQGMLDCAKEKLASNEPSPQFHCGDMLDFLRQCPEHQLSLIFSGWAIGYSHPAAIIAEASRRLKPQGTFAVIVNRLGTMPAVFRAFRQTMWRFPEKLEKAIWPRFPKGKETLITALEQNRFAIDFVEEGSTRIDPPEKNRLDWLLGTGVLAGFDSVLPLREPSAVRDDFAAELDRSEAGWEHHYVMFVTTRKTG